MNSCWMKDTKPNCHPRCRTALWGFAERRVCRHSAELSLVSGTVWQRSAHETIKGRRRQALRVENTCLLVVQMKWFVRWCGASSMYAVPSTVCVGLGTPYRRDANSGPSKPSSPNATMALELNNDWQLPWLPNSVDRISVKTLQKLWKHSK